MIVYRNPDRTYTGEAYDETYRHDPDRFGHAITFRALDELFAGRLLMDRPIRAFDLGCGQGQVIAHVRSLVQQHAPQHLPASSFFGIDISDVAIDQCEQRDPTIHWMADSFQDFLQRRETHELHGTFDLVINKGGLTQVRTADEYQAMLHGIEQLLRPGGLYLFIQYQQFYQVWSNEHCADWDTDIFELGEAIFGRPTRIDDDSAYICVYRRQDKPVERTRCVVPRRMTFHMNDGSDQQVFVSGDELTQARIESVRHVADRDQFTSFEMPADAKDKDIQRHAERVQQARSCFVPGQPGVLLALGRVRMFDARAIDVYAPIADALHSRFNVTLWPGMVSTVRHLCKCAPRVSLARPDIIVIGPGLEDFKIDRAVGLPNVDRDEFCYRLRWVIDWLHREAGGRVVYLATLPTVDFVDDRNGYAYDCATAARYADVAEDVCTSNGAMFIDARLKISTCDRSTIGSALADVLVSTLAQPEASACVR